MIEVHYRIYILENIVVVEVYVKGGHYENKMLKLWTASDFASMKFLINIFLNFLTLYPGVALKLHTPMHVFCFDKFKNGLKRQCTQSSGFSPRAVDSRKKYSEKLYKYSQIHSFLDIGYVRYHTLVLVSRK